MLVLATVASLRCLLREATAEEHVEQLFGCELRLKSSGVSVLVGPEAALVEVISTSHMLLLVLAVKIVRLPLFRVCEHRHSVSDGFESLHRPGRFILIRMHLQCELLVCFFDLRVCRFFGHAEDLVVVLAPAKIKFHKL